MMTAHTETRTSLSPYSPYSLAADAEITAVQGILRAAAALKAAGATSVWGLVLAREI